LNAIVDMPLVVFAVSLVVLWGSARAGDFLRRKIRPLADDERDDFERVATTSLTLLALIIGFSFSMAVSRYDQRKNYEEAEANAIGTEYVRADLLPAGDAARLRDLLKRYLDQRVLFYTTREEAKLRKIEADTAELQNELWSTVRAAAAAQQTPIAALVVAGMNDVLNSEGYTQAAWWNRIPGAAWDMMAAIAICCHLLLGYDAHKTNVFAFLILPFVLSIAFFLIADIDSPRGGAIRVHPQNLLRLVHAVSAQHGAPPPRASVQ
jgi:hypothetical protein